ncbi:MAG: Imm32 family immunity protein [Parachlamydiaceae bacterium]
MNKCLTFEWDPKKELLEIHGNKEGLENLRNILDQLINSPGSDHSHLLAKAWGGNELADEKQSIENTLINQVKIFKWANSE